MIECVSVKISTLFSQIHSLAFDYCVSVLADRLGLLYRAALENPYDHLDATGVPKLVNLDMEAYSDMAVTVEAFKCTLAREEFRRLTAGIALQAYLPDSHRVQKDLTRWARARVDAGGMPIRIRIVKGANMEMERIEAALNDWPLAPYDNKADVDANYKRMVLYGLAPENARAVRLGIASHNIFDLAFAHEVAGANDTADFMMFEMLEGMADHLCRALLQGGYPLLLYAPVAEEKEFVNTVAYLIRRLSENTGGRNFLRHAPFLAPTSNAWRTLGKAFEDACCRIDSLSDTPHRTQNRLEETASDAPGRIEFTNEPVTDWSLAANRQWAEAIRGSWMKRPGDPPLRIAAVVADREIDVDGTARCRRSWISINFLIESAWPITPDAGRRCANGRGHSPPGPGWMASDESGGALYGPGTGGCGTASVPGGLWGCRRGNRQDLYRIGRRSVRGGRFAEYYPYSMRFFEGRNNIRLQGRGAGVVVSPWNFPIAIPCGGILAALAAGNTVILKPASDSVLTAWTLCRAFWEAGISRNTLQFLPGSGTETGMALAGDPEVDFMILTGGTETGLRILRHRPDLFLAAETGGKNATIVTASADRDQAVRNVIQSAFGHGGRSVPPHLC